MQQKHTTIPLRSKGYNRAFVTETDILQWGRSIAQPTEPLVGPRPVRSQGLVRERLSLSMSHCFVPSDDEGSLVIPCRGRSPLGTPVYPDCVQCASPVRRHTTSVGDSCTSRAFSGISPLRASHVPGLDRSEGARLGAETCPGNDCTEGRTSILSHHSGWTSSTGGSCITYTEEMRLCIFLEKSTPTLSTSAPRSLVTA